MYLLSEWSVAKRIRDKFDYLLNMRISEKGPGNRSDQWCIQVSNFNKKMNTSALDIKATDLLYDKQLEAEVGNTPCTTRTGPWKYEQ